MKQLCQQLLPKFHHVQAKGARQMYVDAAILVDTSPLYMSMSSVIIINCRSQFIISRTNAFIFTSPSSDKLRNFSATLALMTRSADSRSSSRLQRRCALGYRLAAYFSRQDNRQLWSAMMFCRSTTPAASAGINNISLSTSNYMPPLLYQHVMQSPQVSLENHQ